MITFNRLGQMGRFGNQLFQISTVIGLAKKYKDIAMFPNWERNHLFKIPILQTKYMPQVLKHYTETSFSYQEIPYTRNMNLIGFFQSYKYFDFCKEEIFKFFDLKDIYRNIIKIKFKDVIESSNSCSIGVRRKDYLEKSKFHTNLTINYYNTALEIIKPDVVLVISDDIDYCKNVLFKDRKNFIFSYESDYIDLFAQTYCKHNIIANSTFHWWGAYINKNANKKVIYPTEWFGPEGKSQDTKDLFLPGWIGINNI